MIKRREFNTLMALGLAAASLPLRAAAQFAAGSEPASALRVSELAAGVSLIEGAGANVVVAEGPESVVVIDGGLREHAEALRAEIERLAGGKPIAALFNSNWRPEHCGLNHLLGPDLPILAHENTRLWQGADFHVEWEERDYQPMPEAARANQGFYTGGSLELGDERIEYGHLPQAHTDGDVYVYFTRADVLVVSDLLGVDAYPVIDYSTGGWVGGMRDATAALLELAGPTTRIVAASGGVQTREALSAQMEMLDKAYLAAANAFKNGLSLEDFRAARPQAEFGERWGDAEDFLTQIYRGTWYRIPGRAIDGII